MILTAMYEPVFKESSHGFRPKRSCHTALEKIRYWAGTKWFIEFDIEGYFDNIDHKILMELLEKKIDDVKFLNVIRKMLRAGYACYVDNLYSTPYPPRETVAYGEGERYGGALCHPSTPGIPAAQSVALCESAEPRSY